MQIIKHRINTIAELKSTPKAYGVEIDLRSTHEHLILHHDPYKTGEKFSQWLEHYHHGTLILNVKEEGLEAAILTLLEKHGVEDFFFLDQSIPFLLKTIQAGEQRCAVRFSELESVETVKAVSDLLNWVWIDCFTQYPLYDRSVETLAKLNLKTCIVSPELQGRVDETEISAAKKLFADLGFSPDAVCTKRPELWR